MLRPETAKALIAFAEQNGKNWKSKLCDLWVRGGDTEELRVARNRIGPSGLYKLSMDDLLRAATADA